MSFFAISTGSWAIRADEFIGRMRAQWPEAVIREVSEPESGMGLDFDLRMPHSRVDGGLDRAGRSFHFDSDLRDAARLALWFRSLAPGSEPMIFCDDSMSGMLELEPGTTETDIFQAFGYTPARPGWMDYDIIARGGWGMPLEALAQRMRERWPSARLVEALDADSRWVFEFHVPMPHSEVSGQVRRTVNAMVLTGDPRDCARFAVWCRSAVHTEQLLLRCDQGTVYLTAETTAEEIVRAFQA
ncbi:MAG TPA: hypothetical protein VE057_03185 [Archangium sp.]|nr:hypothetical protein [Archangium sp.]